MNKIFIAALVFLLAFGTSAPILGQSRAKIDSILVARMVNKGHKYFNNMAYIKAIEVYEDLNSRGFFSDTITRNLALAYFKTDNIEKSEDAFRKLINGINYQAEDVYYYTQALRYNQKYEEADLWIEKYLAMNGADVRALGLKNSAPVIKEILSRERYKIYEVGFNSQYSDFGAVLYREKLIFTSARNDQAIIRLQYSWKETPYFGIYTIKSDESGSIRANRFSAKFSTLFHDGPVCFTSDESEIYLTRNNFRLHLPKKGKEGMNNLKILHAKKNALGKWGTLTEMPFNSNDYSCGHPALSPDEKTLYFASNMEGGYGGTDIYFITKTDSGWSVPVNMGHEINTPANEMFPYEHSDGKFYFASAGHLNLGGLDLFVSKKMPSGKYQVKNMGFPINSSYDDFSLFLLPDGINGYFASNRPGGKGDDDIYKVLITDPVTFTIVLDGNVTDSLTSEKLLASQIELLDGEGKVVQAANTKASNTFSFQVQADTKYSLSVACEKYHPKTLAVDPTLHTLKNGDYFVPVTLAKIIEWGIYGRVYKKGTDTIVPDYNVKTFFSDGRVFADQMTEDTANFRLKLDPETDYQLMFSKPGFLTKRAYYTTKNRKPGWININEFVDIEVQKLEIGATIEIPNIYYDLNKYNIRADAAVELDKVVQFLNDNPTIVVELGSHTDARGSDKSNMTLSQNRAKSAVEYIVGHGIDVKRIKAKGYGESRLKNRCANGVVCDETEHQQNRRTEIIVVGF